MEQRFIIAESTCSKTLAEVINDKIKKQNSEGFRLISLNTIPAKSNGEYSTNEKREMIFEK